MPKGYPAQLAGQRFGSWSVIGRLEELRGNKVMWQCVCDCGTPGTVSTGNLTLGKSTACRSCGAVRGHAKRRADDKK